MRVDTLLCLGGVGAGGRSQPLPGPVQHLPVTAVASAASGLRDYLKSWRAEPWLLRCEDTIAFAVSLFSGDRAALLEGCPVGARVERVLGSRGGGQVESPISHVHLGGPVAWGPPTFCPRPSRCPSRAVSRRTRPRPTRAHEAPWKLLPVTAPDSRGAGPGARPWVGGSPGITATSGAGTQGPSPGEDPHHPPLLGCRLCCRGPTERPAGQSGRLALFLDGRPDSTCRLGSGRERRPGHGCLWLGPAGPSPGRQPMVSRSVAGRAGRVGRAQAADCIAVTMGP